MNLGHGRAGHLPDYSFIRYRYLPAWGDYDEIVKDNPSDYYYAFCQLIYALQYLRGERSSFETGQYALETAAPYEEKIRLILETRKIDTCEEWAAFAESLSGQKIPDFDRSLYEQEYLQADMSARDDTFIGKFILAALAQKSMVTNQIYLSGSLLAGFSVDYADKGFRGISDFKRLVRHMEKEKNHG